MKSYFALILSLGLLITCGSESTVNAINVHPKENKIKKEVESITTELTQEVIETSKNPQKKEKPIELLKKKEKVVEEKATKIKSDLEVVQAKSVADHDILEINPEIHKIWNELTQKHISPSGKVNYNGFIKDKENLNKYIKELQSHYSDLNSWSKNKKLAYWINLYNAVTVNLIVKNYPVKSIKDLKDGKPWDVKLISLGGKSYTLNDIENSIIRPQFNEPRIHFAVNCAAKSCPKILNKAWTENNIQSYLTIQTKAFIANTSENKISAKKVELSKIFDWYKVDFGGSDIKLIEFINKYSDVKVNNNATVNFNDYNWELNE